MSGNVTNELLPGHLKAIQSRAGNPESSQEDIKTSLPGIRQHRAGFMTTAAAHGSAIAGLQSRVDRIGRRPDPVDPPATCVRGS